MAKIQRNERVRERNAVKNEASIKMMPPAKLQLPWVDLGAERNHVEKSVQIEVRQECLLVQVIH